MFDTLMFILFCFGPVLAAYAAVRQEQKAGGIRSKGGWRPLRHDDLDRPGA